MRTQTITHLISLTAVSLALSTLWIFLELCVIIKTFSHIYTRFCFAHLQPNPPFLCQKAKTSLSAVEEK